MQAQLRRYQNILVTTGIAVILFGVWDMVKMFLWATLAQEEWMAWLSEEELAELPHWALLFVVLLVVAIFSLLLLAMNVWIGRGAILEGRGKRVRRPYVAAAVFLVLFTIVNMLWPLLIHHTSDDYASISANSILIDLTVLYARIEMIWTARKVRRLTRELSDASAAAGAMLREASNTVSTLAGEITAAMDELGE